VTAQPGPAPGVAVAFNATQTRARVTLSHPTGNIITADMVGALRAALERLADNPRLKLITIEGAGNDFSFGASIPEHTPQLIAQVLPQMHELIVDLLETPIATAAIVRGRCLGGGFELALACDFIFAATDAVFGLPEIKLGVFPPAASALLPPRTGYSRATAAIVTGAHGGVADWHASGLIALLADAGDLAEAVDEWYMEHLDPKSAVALRHAVTAARMGLLTHVRATLPELERLYLKDLMQTRDAAEGVTAFLEKRAPRWSDR
jgi:cyclohexa-1,5-dienecarbonyl-CoA hydratase